MYRYTLNVCVRDIEMPGGNANLYHILSVLWGVRCSLQRDYYHIHKTLETLLWGVENVWLDTSKLNDNKKEKLQIFILDSNEVKWRSNGDFFFNILLTRFFLLKKNPIITYSLKQGFMSSFSLTCSGWDFEIAWIVQVLALYPYLHCFDCYL